MDRPKAPELFLIPPDEAEVTPTESPLAKAVKEALREPMRRLRADINDRLSVAFVELEGQLCEALVNSVSPRFVAVEQRLSLIERHLGFPEHPPTEPAPPPSEGS